MVPAEQKARGRPGTSTKKLLWFGVLAALLASTLLLALALRQRPYPSQDLNVLRAVSARHLPGLDQLFRGLAVLTDARGGMALVGVRIALLWLIGLTSEALRFTLVGGAIGLLAFASDFALGELVGRSRPLSTAAASFPSGHVWGSVAFFGFWLFLAVHHKLTRRLVVPLGLWVGALIVTAGAARIYLQSHWPSDVAAGYLLGFLWLILLVSLYLRLERVSWLSRSRFREDLAALSCESCRVQRSVASMVLLDPVRGTATKVYRPPPVIRFLYWLSFQAKFPYESNVMALHPHSHPLPSREQVRGCLGLLGQKLG